MVLLLNNTLRELASVGVIRDCEIKVCESDLENYENSE